jgi:hypothetical protein
MMEKFKAADAKARATLVESVGKMAPKAKISTSASQVAQAALKNAVSALTDGTIDLPVVEQLGDQLAPEAFTGLTAFQSLIDGLVAAGVPEAQAYKIDAKLAASDDERLIETAGIIRAAGKDKALAMAVKRMPAAPEAKPEAKPEAAPAPKPAAPTPESMAADITKAME